MLRLISFLKFPDVSDVFPVSITSAVVLSMDQNNTYSQYSPPNRFLRNLYIFFIKSLSQEITIELRQSEQVMNLGFSW